MTDQEVNVQELEVKVAALDVKDKLLVILTEASIPLSALASIRSKVKDVGGLGVLYLPNVDEIRAESLDACISQLQTMKQLLVDSQVSTKGIMTEPDEP